MLHSYLGKYIQLLPEKLTILNINSSNMSIDILKMIITLIYKKIYIVCLYTDEFSINPFIAGIFRHF